MSNNRIKMFCICLCMLTLAGCTKTIDTASCEQQIQEQVTTALNNEIDATITKEEAQLLDSIATSVTVSDITVSENAGVAHITVPSYDSLVKTVCSDSDFINKYRALESIKASDEIVKSNCMTFANILLGSCEQDTLELKFNVNQDSVSIINNPISIMSDIKGSFYQDVVNRMSGGEKETFDSVSDLKSIAVNSSFQIKYTTEENTSLIGITIDSILDGSDATARISEMSSKNDINSVSSKNVKVVKYSVTNLTDKSILFSNPFIAVDSTLHDVSVSASVLGTTDTGLIKKKKTMQFESVIISDSDSNLCFYNGNNLLLISN